MGSKLIVFVVFAALAQQSSFAADSTLYDLTETQTTAFTAITAKQTTVDSERIAAYDTLYDAFDILASNWVNDEDTSIGSTTLITLSSLGKFMESAVTVLRTYISSLKNINYLTIDYNLSHTNYFYKIFSAYGSSIANAKNGVYTTAVQEDEASLIAASTNYSTVLLTDIFGVMGSMQDADDAKIQAAVVLAQTRMIDGLLAAGGYVFSSTATILESIDSGVRDSSLLTTIKNNRIKTRSAIEDMGISEFALFQTFYLQRELSIVDLGTELYSIEYTWLGSTKLLTDATNAIYNTITSYLDGVDSSTSDVTASQDETSVSYRGTFQLFADSIVVIDPTASSIAAATQVKFNAVADTVAEKYYAAIALALTAASSDVDETFATLQEEVIAALPDFIEDVDIAIRNGNTWDDDVEAKITSALTDMQTAVEEYATNNFAAIKTLLDATSNGVADSDYTTVTAYQSAAISAIKDFTYAVSKLSYIVLLAENSA